MSLGGQKGALAPGMGEPDGNGGGVRRLRPAEARRAESVRQPAAEHVVTDVADHAEWGAESLKRESGDSRGSAGADFALWQDALGARPGPGRQRSHDDIDVDIADHIDRSRGRTLANDRRTGCRRPS